MSNDLHIPDAALAAFPDGVLPSARRDAAPAIAAPVVAAELRRIAGEIAESADPHTAVATLRKRAIELDGGAS